MVAQALIGDLFRGGCIWVQCSGCCCCWTAAFCQEFPHIRVDLRLPEFELHSGTFVKVLFLVLKGIAITNLFHGTKVPHLFSAYENADETFRNLQFGRRRNHTELQQLVASAPRLRIFPLERTVDVQALKDMVLQEWPEIVESFPLLEEDDQGAWIVQVQRWILDGI
jgi:hypothetical protein